MKLKSVQIEKFKCIQDTTNFQIDEVTCLMGKNESGKTAILQALYKLNPVEEEEDEFIDLEFPRKDFTEDEFSGIVNVLTTNWELEKEDIEKLEVQFFEGVANSNEVIIKRGYLNKNIWAHSLNQKGIIAHLISKNNFDASEKAQLTAESIVDLFKKIDSIESPSEKQKAFILEANNLFPQKRSSDLILKFLPKLVYFPEYQQLEGRISLSELKERKTDNKLTFPDKIFLALLKMAGSDLEKIENTDQTVRLKAKLQGIQNRLSQQIFEYWKQNTNLKVKFDFRQGLPGDPEPFSQGFNFYTDIENSRHGVEVNFDDRSTGFIWFFSFLIWFSQMKSNYGDNLILLLDEPGLALHGKAQQDLLRYFNEKLKPNYQVIYTSHSPFMIDSRNVFSLRGVEDAVETTKENGQIEEKFLGTKVHKNIITRERDSIVPLQGICGFDIANTLFVGPNIIVVEGPTEFALFHWFSRELIKQGRTTLDIRYAICPSEGAPKISSFVTLFKGRSFNIVVLFDYHDSQKSLVEGFKKAALLSEDHILLTTDFVSQNEADIEDLLGRELYKHIFEKSFNLRSQDQLPSVKPETAPMRLVKEAEQHFRTLPEGFGYPNNFDHYFQADYLLRLDVKGIEKLPGLDFAMNNFEKLFKRLNGLI